MYFLKIFLCLFSWVIICSLPLSTNQSSELSVSFHPRNFIIMVGDGMGYNQSLAARYFHFGNAGMNVYDDFQYKYAETTFSADGMGYDPNIAWEDFQYMTYYSTDSAAAATAMATGVKTKNDYVGVDSNGNPLRNVFEAAEAVGKSTGVVSSVMISHATPASFVVHNISRDNYVEIANDMIYDSDTDVIMGTGNPWFNNDGQPLEFPNTYDYIGGQATWDALVNGSVVSDVDNDGTMEQASLIQQASQFINLQSGPTPEYVIGVAPVFTTLQLYRSGDISADPYVVPLSANVPTLAEMSLAAINVLDNNPKGFGLMIEGGAIDLAATYNWPGRMIEEQIDFDHAVEAVVSWVETNSSWQETILIVTGDHETGYLWGPLSDPDWVPLTYNGIGNLPGMQFYSTSHTNSLVGLYAQGDAAQWFSTMITGVDPVRGNYVDNTSIAELVFKLLQEYDQFLPTIYRSAD